MDLSRVNGSWNVVQIPLNEREEKGYIDLVRQLWWMQSNKHVTFKKKKKEAINSEGETTILTTNTNRKTKRKEKKEGKEKNDNL